jgi:hypothetical protein
VAARGAEARVEAGAGEEARPRYRAEEPEEAGAAEEARPWYRQRRQGIWWR